VRSFTPDSLGQLEELFKLDLSADNPRWNLDLAIFDPYYF